MNHAISVGIAIVLAVAGTWIILKIVDWTIGVRVTAERKDEKDSIFRSMEGYLFQS